MFSVYYRGCRGSNIPRKTFRGASAEPSADATVAYAAIFQFFCDSGDSAPTSFRKARFR